MLWVSVPLVPVMLILYVPLTVELVVDIFRVQLPEPVIDDGLQLTSIPAGIPLSTRPTVPLNPFIAETLTVKVVLLPAVIVCELGEADIEKSAVEVATVTTIVTFVV